MKSLSIGILLISKLALLFNTKNVFAQNNDQFVFRIIDQTISYSDLIYQKRNLDVLLCAYPGSLIIQYFQKPFVNRYGELLKKWPSKPQDLPAYLRANKHILDKMLLFFKLLKFAQDQNLKVNPQLEKVMIESVKTNQCSEKIFQKNGLKENFRQLLKLELYMRSRYGQESTDKTQNAENARGAMELFMDSLQKQFQHEVFW